VAKIISPEDSGFFISIIYRSQTKLIFSDQKLKNILGLQRLKHESRSIYNIFSTLHPDFGDFLGGCFYKLEQARRTNWLPRHNQTSQYEGLVDDFLVNCAENVLDLICICSAGTVDMYCA